MDDGDDGSGDGWNDRWLIQILIVTTRQVYTVNWMPMVMIISMIKCSLESLIVDHCSVHDHLDGDALNGTHYDDDDHS